MALKHAQFQLGDYQFGDGHPVYPSSVTKGKTDWTHQDTENPVADGIYFGRDYRRPTPWQFEFTITGKTPAEATKNLHALATAWDYQRRTWSPLQTVPLVFNRHGVEQRIYGRPRNFEPDDNDAWVLETVKAKGEFHPASTQIYENKTRSVSLTLTPGRAGGLIFPVKFPWSTTEAGRRQGIIDNGGGTLHTNDVTITITGPINRPKVKGPGWTLQFTTNLKHDQSVTVNALTQTVLRNNGASLAGALTRSSRIDHITIPPGQSEIFFEGEDTSGTSRLTVTWRPATA
ncbi:hypothetical protein [uncultured Brevibacterium sp.]|uniref:hypothetical protein n=1 Tax=uncultured Brevibacterium sp. TaxID=189678 RepID=UPI0025FE63A2|nr:hypothetical protein [uncultured Brevibacterium sp.]